VWADVSSSDEPRQRIDYNDGAVSLFFLPRRGKSWEIVPTGYRVGGYAFSSPATAFQAFFPDLSNYLLIASDVLVRNISCSHYQFIEKNFSRTGTYSFYIANDATQQPIQFHFMGFDELYGSHYDDYVFDYFSYEEGVVESSVFHKLDGFSGECQQLNQSGPIERNWGFEPAENHDKMDDKFEGYKSEHGKVYNGQLEHRRRQHIWRQNIRFVDAHNRRGLGYQLRVNHLADWTDDELRALHPNARGVPQHSAPMVFEADSSTSTPSSIDWREKGAVAAVKDQAICGSCWAFGSVAAIEGALFIKSGKLTRLSSQALVDCSWEFGNLGCDGGFDFWAYEWIMQAGFIPTEESYPYTMQDGRCRFENTEKGTAIRGYVNVTSGDEMALRQAIALHGPISVSIDASHRTLSFYDSGIYYDPVCSPKLDDLDHVVAAVGYGVDEQTGEGYWIVRNSWSSYWGDQGYIRISMRDNICGVATAPTFVVI